MDDYLGNAVQIGQRARTASRELALASTASKDRCLQLLIDLLQKQQAPILAANHSDVERGKASSLSAAMLDRLTLTPARLQTIQQSLHDVIALNDPIGEVISQSTRPNGLDVRKVRVPLGVIFFIYESRPNVTIDAAALAIKSGNAIILRGGKEASASNTALYSLIRDALQQASLPLDAVQLVTQPDRQLVTALLKQSKYIDVAIPRGGEGLIRTVAEEATMPVLKHYQGICHLYVDQHADLQMALQILLNGKCQRPGVCNALESLLVHEAIAVPFFKLAGPALAQAGVEIRSCPRTCELVPEAKQATEQDYHTEYLALILSSKVVKDFDEAIAHIQQHSSGHSEAIITNDSEAARRFTQQIDSAAVLVNASTRFHDGYELGLGGEIGISTDKFHARGPCGLVELTSYKYVITGSGHVRP
jgi:glutamate-5-semialdehyde dehydrogenase